MSPCTLVSRLFICSLVSASLLGSLLQAQSPLWADLRPGPHAVGFRIIDTSDATRSFRAADGRIIARPVRLYFWYAARPGTGLPLSVRDLISEGWANGGVMVPNDSRAFARTAVRVRAGPAFASMSDSAADALLSTALVARRGATPSIGRFPVVLLAPGQPLTMPVTAEYLASHGMLVIGIARKDERTFESMAFTPNTSSVDAEADDLAFALGVVRGRRDVDDARLGLVGYSSSGLSSLAFAFRSRAPRAVAVFEGWEGWDVGQPIVRGLRQYDPRGFRTAYLMLEKSGEESAPGFAKTSAFFDSMVYSPRWRITFDGAAHADFASLGVSLASASPTIRRNFTRAHEVLRDFMLSQLAGSTSTVAWRPPAATSWMRVSSFDLRPPVPTNDEFFHLAETDPQAADTLARRLASLSPPIIPFTAASISRLALLASSRRPADAATLRAMVARAFPSTGASP